MTDPCQKLSEMLGLRDRLSFDDIADDAFNPWEMFPMFYGSYSREFDDMALEVLRSLLDINFRNRNEGLAHQMFREVLCTTGLCGYGTSPRVCFSTLEFRGLLPEFIRKWEVYAEAMWKNK